MVGVGTIDNTTVLGGESLHSIIETLAIASMELLDRGEVTPSMLTVEETKLLTNANDLYLVLLNKLGDMGDD